MRVLQRRPTNPVERWDENRYSRVIATPGGLSLVEVENRGTLAEPVLRAFIRRGSQSKASRAEVARVLRIKLGLDVDPRPLQRAAEAEPALREIAPALRGMRPPRFADLFEAFANVIPFQQVSLEAGIAVLRKLVERFAAHVDHAGRRYHAFPTAATIADARLDSLHRCGLSHHKAMALKNCARLVAAGEITEETLATASTPDALAILSALPGIGAWSAALVMLRGLGRLDVFPPGDAGVLGRLGMMNVASDAALKRVLGRLGDVRGYLYFCVIGGALLERGLISAP